MPSDTDECYGHVRPEPLPLSLCRWLRVCRSMHSVMLAGPFSDPLVALRPAVAHAIRLSLPQQVSPNRMHHARALLKRPRCAQSCLPYP